MTPADGLTREQVINFCEVLGSISDWIVRVPLVRAIVDHDAALRAQVERLEQEVHYLEHSPLQAELEQMTQERDEARAECLKMDHACLARDATIARLEEKIADLESESPTYKEICKVNQKTITTLTAQLAACERGRDAIRDDYDAAQYLADSTSKEWKLCKQALAMAQARITELEAR